MLTALRRFSLLLVTVVALAGCGSGSDSQMEQVQQPAEPAATPGPLALDPSVPEADPKKYADVIDAAEWKNPFLVVGASSVEIVVEGERRPAVSVTRLAETLAKLPASAWPYGRVVAARTLADADADAQTRVDEALAPLGIAVEWWPSE